MLHRFRCAKEGEDGLEVDVGQILENHHGHDGAQLAGLDLSGADDVQEKSLVVVRDSGGIGGDVRAGDRAPWAREEEASSKLHTRNILSPHLSGMAVNTTSLVGEVSSIFELIGGVDLG